MEHSECFLQHLPALPLLGPTKLLHQLRKLRNSSLGDYQALVLQKRLSNLFLFVLLFPAHTAIILVPNNDKVNEVRSQLC